MNLFTKYDLMGLPDDELLQCAEFIAKDELTAKYYSFNINDCMEFVETHRPHLVPQMKLILTFG